MNQSGDRKLSGDRASPPSVERMDASVVCGWGRGLPPTFFHLSSFLLIRLRSPVGAFDLCSWQVSRCPETLFTWGGGHMITLSLLSFLSLIHFLDTFLCSDWSKMKVNTSPFILL